MSDVAYSGTVQMHEAKWTDREGSTVTFKLPMAGMEGQRNPFEKWTKRRKGMAGTRFVMVCADKDMGQVIYQDEVMLAGWNDSQSTGHTVKFWLCSDVLGHPFEGYTRHDNYFVITMVELDDDQVPIDQKMRDKVESKAKTPSERLSYVAAMLCKNEGFWTYLQENDWEMRDKEDAEAYARQFILETLGIDTRAELDKDPVIAERFHNEIRRPFLMWQGEY